MKLRRLKRKRATDEVYDALREAILSRKILPGKRLQVEEIATDLGVSLTPVRHAIQQLSTEGLVEIRPRSGTFVATLSLDDIEATFDIRCALECLAAEKAVERITEAELDRVDELLAILGEQVSSEETLRKHERANSELHELLILSSGNNRLAEIYKGLNAHLTIARIHASERKHDLPKDWTGRFREEHAEHTEIAAALRARNLSRLKAALTRHIHRGKAAMIVKHQAAS